MEISPTLIPTLLAQYPIVLVAFYCFVWMLPRSMSIVLGLITGVLIAYSLFFFPDEHWGRLHYWMLHFDLTPSTELSGVPEDYRENIEKAFTKGYYNALVSCITLLVVILPFIANARVEEAISNIGRRPPTGRRSRL